MKISCRRLASLFISLSVTVTFASQLAGQSRPTPGQAAGQGSAQPGKSNAAGSKSPSQPQSAGKGTTSPPVGKPPNVSIQSKLAADVAIFGDKGDYVPCEFSRSDLLTLRPQPDVIIFDAADEDALRSLIIAEALDTDNANAFAPGERDNFVRHIAEASLEGLTPSSAKGKVLYLLSQATAPSIEVGELLSKATKSNPEYAEYLQDTYHIDSKVVVQKLGQSPQPPEIKLDIASALAQEKLAKAPSEANSLLMAAGGTNQNFTKYLSETFSSETFGVDVARQLGSTERSQESKLEVAAEAADAAKQTAAKDLADQADGLALAATLDRTVATGKEVLNSTPAKNQIAQVAQQVTAAITRPLDVACSMATLSYETTRYAFGQKIADEFIPVQIVVRNLNKDREFLVHDAQVAVDEDINGRRGRYASGIDKLTVRTFMLASRDYNHRNLVVHLAQGAGTVLSSVSLVYGAAVKDAANVYSSGFLNALTGVWTDHGTEQLNLLNDEGFSSYRTERTVVPKSGTAEFIIFIRSDQFQEGWWVQDCAENIVVRNPEQLHKSSPKDLAQCVGQFNLDSPDPKCWANTEIGVDLDAARRVCTHFYKSASNRPKSGCSVNADTGEQSCASELVDIGSDPDFEGDLAYFKSNSVPYKKWSPRARALFRELALAVVAGTHIEEQVDTKPTVTKIDCPKDELEDVDFDKGDNGALTCILTGSNLDKIQTLKLRNSADATDTKTANGNVITTTSANSTITKASFTLDALGALPAKLYKVYTVAQDGVESGGDQVIHLSAQAYLPAQGKPDPNSVNLEDLLGKNPKSISITLKGYHLDALQAVRLAKAVDDKTNASVTAFDVSVDPGPTAGQAQVTLKQDDVKKGKISGDFTTQKLELSIALISKDSPNVPIATKQVLYATGNVIAAPTATTKPPLPPIDEKTTPEVKTKPGA
jgi:hypothetical protein